MWKPLSIVSGLVLVGAGGLMQFVVQPQYKAEKAQVEAAHANLKSAKGNQDDSDAKNKAAKEDIKKSDSLLKDTTGKRELAMAAKAQAVKETEEAQKKSETEEKALADLTTKLKGLGGLEEVVAKLKTLEAKKAQFEADKKNTQEATTALIAHKEATDKVITALKLREIYQKTGTVKEGASTRIVEASQELGFFVLGGGNAANITKNSKWDVVRGDTIIGRLVVTHIEQSRSIAELVPGTLVAGNQILPGDRVVVSTSSTPRALAASITSPAKNAAGKKDGAKPAAGGTTPAAADPFAAPGGTQPMEKPAAETTPAPAPAEAPAPAPAPAEAPKEDKPATP